MAQVVRTWSVEKRVGSSWVSDGTIPRATTDLLRSTTKNVQNLVLFDGTKGRIIAPTKTLDNPYNFEWSRIIVGLKESAVAQGTGPDITFKTKIKAYTTDNTGIRITLHDGEQVTGYLDQYRETWPNEGRETQRWILRVQFTPFTFT